VQWCSVTWAVTVNAFDRRTFNLPNTAEVSVTILQTGLPSNLWSTTCECMHLVMRSHFRSGDKYAGQTVWSTLVANALLHANFVALCFIEQELLPMKALHCGNGNFQSFWLLRPWTCTDDLHIRTLLVFPGNTLYVQIWTFYIKASESCHLTDRHDQNYTPHRFASGQWINTTGEFCLNYYTTSVRCLCNQILVTYRPIGSDKHAD